ncbi:hypothetical protein ACFY71_18820 [Streptomyces cinerochromogenes]|uniref:Transposase n=1 Tax=Streptomyces cinerochromogenes TaxID=66422 RepID=A0ABW7B4B7_9ACTN
MKLIRAILEKLKGRWQRHVRPHVSSEGVRTAGDLVRLAIWLDQHWPWR